MLNGNIFFSEIFDFLIFFSVMEFINEANMEHIQNLAPYCCKSYDECKHQGPYFLLAPNL